MSEFASAATLNLAAAIAQLLVPRTTGFLLDRQRLYPNWELNGEHLAEAVALGVGGVLLFGGSVGDTACKVRRLQQDAGLPLLVGADLEAGCGQHIRGATSLPTARAIGETGNPALAFRAGALTGREALAVGINWVFAPCLDVNSNPDNPVIGPRAFGEDPETVAEMGLAFAHGLASTGVINCAKHFPGHGDVDTDSHLALPVVSRSRRQLEREDWLPFKRAIEAGIDSIMTAHLQVPALDPDAPATLSKTILTDLLRKEWGYPGLIVTDALNMQAVSGLPDLEVRALEAGADVLLMPADVPASLDRILAAVWAGRLHEERIYASVDRILALKARLGQGAPAPEALESVSDPGLAEQIAIGCLALVRDRSGLLPLREDHIDCLIVDRLLDGPLTSGSPLLEHLPLYWLEASTEEDYLRFLSERAAMSKRVVVHVLTPIRAYRGTSAVHPAGTRFIENLPGDRSVLVSYGNPRLGEVFDHLSTVINAFDSGLPAQRAVLARLRR